MLKQQPKRMCIACRGLFDKGVLMRVVRTPEGELLLDKTGKKSGRGAYICDNLDCLKKCVKSKLLNKSFKIFVSEEKYNELLDEYIKSKEQ